MDAYLLQTGENEELTKIRIRGKNLHKIATEMKGNLAIDQVIEQHRNGDDTHETLRGKFGTICFKLYWKMVKRAKTCLIPHSSALGTDV